MTDQPAIQGEHVNAKIKTLDELGNLAEQLRAQGEVLVLTHGVFDVLHLGHLRHLSEAGQNGTKLIVTVTCDAHVNKGPDRPLFPDIIRAEMLAGLECVDYVGINFAPSAENVINTIRPQIFAKGVEYAKDSNDVTNKIIIERHAVEANGGTVVFTDDITFSSSTIINKSFSVHEPGLQEYLEAQRSGGAEKRLLGLIEDISKLKVLFIGDTIIDEYQYVDPLGKAQKENIIATLHHSSEFFAGGVIASANHLAGFCEQVEVFTMLGKQDSYEELVRQSLHPAVKASFLWCADRPSTRKQRFIDRGYLRKLFEIYYMDDTPLEGAFEQKLNEQLEKRIEGCDLVIVNDFGHGLIGPSTARLLSEKSKFLAINTQTNSGNFGYNLVTKYDRADFVCIDAPEARLAVYDKFTEMEKIIAEKLPERLDCDNFIVTQGVAGCVASTKGKLSHHIPAFTTNVVDTVGAGDAFFSIAAPLVAIGADIADAAFVGNTAGALQVGIVGHRKSVEKVALIKYLTALLK